MEFIEYPLDVKKGHAKFVIIPHLDFKLISNISLHFKEKRNMILKHYDYQTSLNPIRSITTNIDLMTSCIHLDKIFCKNRIEILCSSSGLYTSEIHTISINVDLFEDVTDDFNVYIKIYGKEQNLSEESSFRYIGNNVKKNDNLSKFDLFTTTRYLTDNFENITIFNPTTFECEMYYYDEINKFYDKLDEYNYKTFTNELDDKNTEKKFIIFKTVDKHKKTMVLCHQRTKYFIRDGKIHDACFLDKKN